MLKFKVNTKENANKVYQLYFDSIESSSDGENIVFRTHENHHLKNNDIVRFYRNINDSVIFHEDMYILYIDENSFAIPSIQYNTLNVSNISTYNDGKDTKYLITLGEPHNFIGENVKIKGNFNIENGNIILDGIKICPNDYFMINDIYLYQSKIESKDVLTINDYIGPLNTTCSIYTTINIDDTFENEEIKCIVPILFTGESDRNHLVVESCNFDFSLLDKSMYFFCYDERFLRKIDEKAYELTPLSTVSRIANTYNFTLDLGQIISADLYRTELVDRDFVEAEKKKAINPIINMEKYMFRPVCFSQVEENKEIPTTFYDISEICFNLHFRDRMKNGSIDSNWLTEDSKYWNGWNVNSNGALSPTYPKLFINGGSQSDLLGYLGFTNQDILYQRSKLKQSFIRILLYDSPDPNTQTLVYYATIFFDTNTLFSKYVNNLINPNKDYVDLNGDTTESIGAFNEYNPNVIKCEETSGGTECGKLEEVVEAKRLSSQITIKDNYNTDACSEGFYLYLFAENAPSYVPKPYYMKVEFNHAGYGITIPFIKPTIINENGNIIPLNFGDDEFPLDYVDYKLSEITGYNGSTNDIGPISDPYNYKPTESNYNNNAYFYSINEDGKKTYYAISKYINMNKLYNDLYFTIYVKYDFEKKEYIWYLPYAEYENGFENGNFTGKMVINLYEPKLQ